METDDSKSNPAEKLAFLNFLRGMETAGAASAEALRSSFLNFLRGMETTERGNGGFGSTGLPKLP